MFGFPSAWFQSKTQQNEMRLAYLHALRAHEARIANSYLLNGKRFKCGPWRWRVRAKPGTILIWAEKI